MGKHIKAAIFDIDGMLLDTREFIYQAYEYTLPAHGYPAPTRTAIAELIGRSLQDAYKTFAPDGDFEQLFKTHNVFQDQKMDLVVAYKGLDEMLNTLKNAGLKIGAFSSRHGNLVRSLEHVGVAHYFDEIIGGNEVTRHKPDPEGLHLLLSRLHVTPDSVSMAGDAVVDIEAGQAAAVALTIAITHGFGTREALAKAQPTYIVDSLEEIPSLLLRKS